MWLRKCRRSEPSEPAPFVAGKVVQRSGTGYAYLDLVPISPDLTADVFDLSVQIAAGATPTQRVGNYFQLDRKSDFSDEIASFESSLDVEPSNDSDSHE